jgi:hypothetical protein
MRLFFTVINCAVLETLIWVGYRVDIICSLATLHANYRAHIYIFKSVMQYADILAIANLRIDGRRYNEQRNIKYKIGVELQADGSAYFEQGLNKVLVMIHGPQEMRHRSNEASDKVH